MRRWGIIVTVFYAIVVLGLVVPGVCLVTVSGEEARGCWGFYEINEFTLYFVFPWSVLLLGGQALLLFLSVDTSWRRLKPRRHLAYSTALTALLSALLTFFAIFSMAAGYVGDEVFELPGWNTLPGVYLWWVGLWIAWGIIFYRYYRGGSMTIDRTVSWLLKGSVLELLIAVPAHVVVRNREDCSAPLATGFGIATGIAIMLLCFGPGVLALYKKRIDAYDRRHKG